MSLSHEDAKDQQKFMDNSVRRDLTSATVSDVKVENVDSLNKDLTTTQRNAEKNVRFMELNNGCREAQRNRSRKSIVSLA